TIPGVMRKTIRYSILALALIGGFFTAFWPGPAPDVAIVPSRPGVGRAGTTVVVRVREGARGITHVRVEALQNGAAFPLDERAFPSSAPWIWRKGDVEAEIPVELGPDTVPGLAEGQLVLRVEALGTGAWLRGPRATTTELTLPVRLIPPQLAVTSRQNYAAQGGSGIVVYRVEASVLEKGGVDGVEAGGSFFPGLPLPEGGASDRFALYGVPYDLTSAEGIRLVAEDPLGNRTTVSFVERYFPRPMRSDTIRLTVDFMNKVVPEILSHTPEIDDRGDLLANYLTINRELRAQNAETLRDLVGRSREVFLWSGRFDPLPGSEATSSFADRRTYLFEDREVDRQDHLGFDLASVRGAPVPAANRGVVVLARYFGIYGNSVVLDHGAGLMSLYSHLSSIEVALDQEVEKGQAIGRTGQTGLAGGDHLHFTLLIRGLPVNPIEWWDPMWVRDRVVAKLSKLRP
ncbi:MAG: M23 family metallopeptidase, partial [Vicinamibacteria bacterium]